MTDRGEMHQERTAQEDTYPFSAAHYRLGLEAAGIGLGDWELTQDRQIWTSQCKAIFGLAPEEEIGYLRFLSLLHIDDQERVDRLVEESLIKRTEYSTEYRVIWPDGGLHWVGARGRGIYDEAGMPVRMIGVAFDVTPSKAVEEVQRQADE